MAADFGNVGWANRRTLRARHRFDPNTSWADAHTGLQDALGDAADGDEIWKAAGEYTPITPADVDNVSTTEREATFQLKGELTDNMANEGYFATMPQLNVDLSIGSTEFLRYYQWKASSVRVVDDRGQSIRFPAIALREHVTHQGIHGQFRLEADDDHRLIRLIRLS